MAPRRDQSRTRSSRADSSRAGTSRSGSPIGGDQVEGRRAVLELLRAQARPVRTVYVAGDSEHDPVLDEIAERAGNALRPVSAERLASIARTDAPQGVVALASGLRPVELDDLLAADDAFLVALDGVTDPQNLGAIVRSAETAGATGVVVPRHRAARVTPAVTKAAAGAIEHVPFALVAGIPAALERAARAGCWTVGLDERGDRSLFALDVADQRIVLVLGAEGRGLARLTRERCDLLVRIPMHGALESLNVAAAAALACHEVARRRHA
jgi:23S rRNA (guanosine2251-2'-O)-methyltransferase